MVWHFCQLDISIISYWGLLGGEGWLGGGGGGWLGGEEGIIFLGGYEVWIIFLTFEIDFFIAKKRIYIMTSVLPDSGSH